DVSDRGTAAGRSRAVAPSEAGLAADDRGARSQAASARGSGWDWIDSREARVTTAEPVAAHQRNAAPDLSWQRNLYALTGASFLMFTAFGFVFPFLPLYIAQLGVGGVQQVELWAGFSSFGQALVLAFFSPIWGAVADRHGRRLMLLRAAFGGGVIIGLM